MDTPKLQVVPVCLGMVLADLVWRDPGTGKHFILGTMSVIRAPGFPAVHQAGMAVYCVLTDGRGMVPLSVRLLEASDDSEEPLLVQSGEVAMAHPKTTTEAVFYFQNIVFPRPGEYRFQLRCGSQLLMERRLELLLVPSPQQAGG